MELSKGFKQTEAGKIPSDWLLRPFSRVAKIASGQVDPKYEPYASMALVAPDHIESATGRLLKIETAKEQNAISGKYLFSKGDVVYSKIRPYLKKVILANFDGLCSADMYPLRPSNDVNSIFLKASLLDYRFSKYAESVSVRSGMPKINRQELAEFSFVFPPTLKEQDAIANALSDADAYIESLEKLITKKRLIKKGVMQELLTGKRRLDGFRGQWQQMRMRDCVSIPNGQVDPKVAPYINMKLIGPEHVETETGYLIRTETAGEQNAISGKYLFRSGDVLYGKINPYLKKATLVNFDGLCSADMYPLRAKEGIDSKFLFYTILGEHFSRFAESVSMRSGMPKINRDEIGSYLFKVPPLDEQTQIAEILVDIDEDIKECKKNLRKVQLLKQGMMQELLTGRIRLV